MSLALKAATAAAFLSATLAPLVSAPAGEDEKATLVKVDEVRLEPTIQTVPVIGRLVARQTGVVAARIEGAVATVEVDVGDRVKKGDVLAVQVADRLEWEREFKAAEVAESAAELANARAQLALSRQELSRIERLRKSAAFSQARFEDKRLELTKYQTIVAKAQARLKAAKASLKLAEIDLQYAKIRAPYGGVVTVRHTLAGAYLKEGEPVVSLVNDNNLEVEAEVPSKQISGLTPGATVQMELEDKSRHTAVVRAVVPEENPRTRTRKARFSPRFDGTRMHLANNQTAVLHLPIGARRMVVSVHKDALVNRKGKPAVFVVENGKAELREVRLGEAIGGRFEILGGLEPGELVVVRGNERLRPGRSVRF